MTQRVEDVLDLLHRSRPQDEVTTDVTIDNVFKVMDELADIASLDSISQHFFNRAPKPTPGLPECNEVLERVDVTKVSPDGMICLLRGTFTKRTLLPAWPGLRDRSYWELKERGENADSILWGLFERNTDGTIQEPPKVVFSQSE